MKTVLILGAGASRAEAISQGARKAQRPPLDTDFFELAEMFSNTNIQRSAVDKYMRETYQICCFKHPRPRMEEVFGLVYANTIGAMVTDKSKPAFVSLCKIYSNVIADTTNWLTPSRKGPLCRLLYNLRQDGELKVISFNQDLLLEKALSVLTKASGPIGWYPNIGYCLDFSKVTAPTSTFTDVFDLAEDDANPDPLVLKPHGSLNWYTVSSKNNRIPTLIKKDRNIHCTRRTEILHNLNYKDVSSKRGRTRWYTWPIIVPPVIEKGSFLGSALASVWQGAWDAISVADRIVVYGYSFPDSDQQSKGFFQRARAKMNKSPYLVAINPDAIAAAKAAEVFRPSIVVACSSVSDLLRHGKKVVGNA